MQEFLTEHEVTIAATIVDALHILDEPFDAVLVDDGKGTAVVEVPRQRRFGGRIMVMSSHELERAARRCGGRRRMLQMG